MAKAEKEKVNKNAKNELATETTVSKKAPAKEVKQVGKEPVKETKVTKKEPAKESKPRRATSPGKPNFFKRIGLSLKRWFNETIGELRKVTWPTRQEAWYLTKIVIVVVIIMSLALGLLDLIFSRGIALLIK